MATFDLFAFINNIPSEVRVFAEGVIALVVVLVVYKLISNYLSSAGRRIELDDHALNSIRLILRVVTILLATSIIFTIYQLPTDLFVGGSALIGAIVGFGSSQTINNIAAGFYVLISRPFRVKDYVRIGDVEGQVEEIAINYTKLYTPTFNMLLIPNTQVMSNRVLNCTHEGFIKYTFSMSLPHSDLSNDEIVRKCFEPAVDEYMRVHSGENLRRPEYFIESSAPLGRSFKVRIFTEKGDAGRLYRLQPELFGYIIERWDKEKANLKPILQK